MSPNAGRILIVEDERELLEAMVGLIRMRGYDVDGFTVAPDALARLREEPYDILISDLMLPGTSGIDVVREALSVDAHLVPLLMTGQATVHTAVEAMRAGAFDYITKPFTVASLEPVLARAMELRRLKLENLTLREGAAIREMSVAVAESFDLPTVLDRVAAAALEASRGDELSIVLPAADRADMFRVAAVRGPRRAEIEGMEFPAAGTIAGWAAEHGEAVALSGAVDDPRFRPVAPRPVIRHALVVPMVIGRHVIGVLCVNARDRIRPFTPGERRALELLTQTAASAVERGRLVEQLRHDEARYRSVVTSLDEGLIIVRGDGTLEPVNGRAAQLLGLDEATLQARSAADAAWRVVRADGRGMRIDEFPWNQCLATGEPQRDIVIGVPSAGDEPRWLSVNVSPLHGDRGALPEAVVAIFSDITERRRARALLADMEEQLRLAQKMEAVGALAGGIAHDFNNLLGAARVTVDLLAMDAGDNVELKRSCHELIEIVEQGRGLTRQMLAFSRRQELETAPVDLGELVTGTTKMLRRLIGEHVELDVQPAGAPSVVLADRSQLEQVLMNLCVNARDAMPEGGTVAIGTTVVDLDEAFAQRNPWAKPGRFVRLEVRDSGSGMDAKTRGRIFEPFFTTKPPGKGTGLGLSVAYGIVRQHGGFIDLETAPGEGTTFDIYLPVYEVDEQVPQHPQARLAGGVVGGTETILIAEDEEPLRRTAMQLLERLGYRVMAAADGQEALRALEANVVDLVVADMGMPVMGGYELWRRTATLGRRPRFLFVSGHDLASFQGQEAPPGPRELLQKPYGLADLATAVRRTLDARSA